MSGGTRSNSTSGNSETFIATFDHLNGNLGYNYRDPSTQEEYYNDVTQGLNGNIANCGITRNPIFGYDGIIDMYWSFYVYYNFFSKGTTMYEEFYAISKTEDKGFVTIGKTTGYSAALEDIFIMKMDSTGNYGPSIVSVHESEKSNISFSIFPNPSDQIITISIENNFDFNELSYVILSLNGSQLKSNKITHSKTTIETSTLEPGLYFVQLLNKMKVINCSKISVIR